MHKLGKHNLLYILYFVSNYKKSLHCQLTAIVFFTLKKKNDNCVFEKNFNTTVIQDVVQPIPCDRASVKYR